jgi:hypothetical protein
MWLSVDGSRSSVIKGHIGGRYRTMTLPGCVGGRQPGGPCTPQPAFFPAMPTVASAIPAWLARAQGVRLNDINDLAKTVGEMFEFDYLLPRQRAALYEFLATTPRLIKQNVRGPGGRTEIGVGWFLEGSKSMLVFDPRDYTLVGWGVPGQAGGDAQLTQPAIVNQVGQLP